MSGNNLMFMSREVQVSKEKAKVRMASLLKSVVVCWGIQVPF